MTERVGRFAQYYLLGQLVKRDVLLRYRGAMFSVAWVNVFSDTISRAPTAVKNYPNCVKKIIFPVEVLPLVPSVIPAACRNLWQRTLCGEP